MTDFDTVKSKLPIAELVQSYGGERKKNFVNPSPCCDHNDCFSVDEDKNLWKCFSCGKGGSVIDLVMAVDECDEYEALRKCAETLGIELDQRSQEAKEKTETPQERMYRLAAEYYHQNMLLDDSGGKEWFCKFRKHSEKTLKKMKAGWSIPGLMHHLQTHSFTIDDCVNLGLAVNKDDNNQPIPPRDYFWSGLAIFPVYNHNGKVITFTAKNPKKQPPSLMIQGIKKNWLLNYHILGKYQEYFVVEGENDIASLLDAECDNVFGTAGAPGRDQITQIKNLCPNQTLYLWFDKDPKKDIRKNEGGPHHTRFLIKELLNSDVKVRIVVHPGEAKDPDEYIQGFFNNGFSVPEIRAHLKTLKEQALDPIAWEIKLIESIPEAKDRLDILRQRKIPQLISSVRLKADQEIYTDLLAKSVGISDKAAQDLVISSYSENLKKELFAVYGNRMDMQKLDGVEIGEYIYKWFSNGTGARFFKTPDKKNWLFHRNQIFEIGRGNDFDSLMLDLSGLIPQEKPGPAIWHTLSMLCSLRGEYVEMVSWLFTDKEKDHIYLNLSSRHNKIIKLSPGNEPIVIDNGTNEESVLLSPSCQIRPFEYQSEVSEAEGFGVLKQFLFTSIPIENPQRYFIICWMISTFLMNYQGDRGLLQIVGSSALGKSKVLERISQLIFGENYCGQGTNAADTRSAINNPITFQDNLENHQLTKDKVYFLLLLANSASRPKAKSGSDTEIVLQKLNSMGIISSIEAFPGKLPELLNRTFQFWLDARYKIPGYIHDEYMRNIKQKRNLMLSAILKLISKTILLKLGDRIEWSRYINTRFSHHNKDRNNEHICTMLIILESILEHIPYQRDQPVKKQAAEICEYWITYQEEHAKQIAVTSNTLLTIMDGIAREIRIKIRGRGKVIYQHYPSHFQNRKVVIYDDPEYLECFYLTEADEEITDDENEKLTEKIERLEFIVTAADLFTIFNRYCANQHIRNPYDSPNALGARLSNDKEVMERAGWQYISQKEDEIKYRKSGGKWYWRFSKKIIISQ